MKNVNAKEFAKMHKKQTGYSLKSEQVDGEVEELTPEDFARIFAEAAAYGK